MFLFILTIPGFLFSAYLHKLFHRSENYLYYNHRLSRPLLNLISFFLSAALGSLIAVWGYFLYSLFPGEPI